MSWHYLPGLAGDSSLDTSSDGLPSAPWKKSPTDERCSCDGSGTVCFPCSRSGTTAEPSTGDPGVVLWMSSQRASRANPSPSPASAREPTTPATDGRIPSASFARYDPDTRFWKTCLGSLALGISDVYSGTWPKQGTMRSGRCSVLMMSAPRIDGNGSGSWPTPRAGCPGSRRPGTGGRVLAEEAKRPTPRASERCDYQYDQGDHSKPRLTLQGQVKAAESDGGTSTPQNYPTPSASLRTAADMEQARYAGNDPRRPSYQEAKRRTFPTPKSSPSGPDFARMNREGNGGDDLVTQIARESYPTPSARDWRSGKASEETHSRNSRPLNEVIHKGTPGQLNPEWVEWLMGFPIGYSDLRPSETGRFRQWLRLHGRC